MNLAELETEISQYMPLGLFLRIHKRLAELRSEEELKLKALSELQPAYNSASSDQQRDLIHEAVAQLRELSRAHRKELRELQTELQKYITVDKGRQLYAQWTAAGRNSLNNESKFSGR
jgi:CHASE3 domain sensor protein